MNDLKAKGYLVDKNNKARKVIDIDQPVSFPIVPDKLFDGKLSIFIPGNVPSSKNSRRLVVKNGKPKSYESKLCAAYKEQTRSYWINYTAAFKKLCIGKEKPIRVVFYFIRSSNRRFDWHNLVQLPLDLMSQNSWIDDDNISQIVPVPPNGAGFHVNPKNPGVIISVI